MEQTTLSRRNLVSRFAPNTGVIVDAISSPPVLRVKICNKNLESNH